MAIRELKDQIARLPEQPGVYLYFNAAGETIYVGKARALRDRVRNYLGAYGSDPKTDALLDEIARLEFIVTDSVVEALALENNLIKQRSPKYNILLRDDKNYPYLQLTTNEAFPRVLVARRVERDGSFYAGPFLPARFARKTMALTHRLFGIRSCNEVITGKRDRPCLEYDIKRCIAPCVDTLCSAEEYGRAVEMTQMFLEGQKRRTREKPSHADAGRGGARAIRGSRRVARCHADRTDARRAPAENGDDRARKSGRVRLENRRRAARSFRSFRSEADASSNVWSLAPTRRLPAPNESDVIEAAIEQFYELRIAPPEVHVPAPPAEQDALESWLSERAGRKVRIVVPQRGEKRGLVDLASRNAELAYQRRFNQAAAAQYEALNTLQAVLALANPPAPDRVLRHLDDSGQRDRRVDGRVRRRAHETIGLSEVPNQGARRGQGLEAGGWRCCGVRRGCNATSNLQPPASVPDDFAAMEEVVRRRYRKMLEEGGPFPDLILIDGGKGQLTAAYAALAGSRARKSGCRRHREERRAAVHARSRPADCARGERSGAAAPAADSRRSASVRGHVSPQGAIHARPAFRARRRAWRRSTSSPHAADEIREPRRRATGDARRIGGGRRREKSPMPFLRFSQARHNLYALARHRFRAGIHHFHRSAFFPDGARDGARMDGRVAWAIRRRGCWAACR